MTRGEAAQFVIDYNQGLYGRVNAFLDSVARSGVLGGVYNYGTVPDLRAQAVANALTLQGWTVVVDTVGKTLTIS